MKKILFVEVNREVAEEVNVQEGLRAVKDEGRMEVVTCGLNFFSSILWGLCPGSAHLDLVYVNQLCVSHWYWTQDSEGQTSSVYPDAD